MKSLENNIAERINFLTRSSSKIRLKKRNKYKAKKVKKNRKAYSKKRMKASSSKSIVRNVKKQVIQNPIHNSNNLSNKTVVNPIDQIIINEMKRKISLQSNLTLNRNSTILRIQPNISNIISVNKTISQQRINNTTQLIQNARVQNAKNNVNKVVSNLTLAATKRNITVNNKNLAVSTNLSKLMTSNTTLQKRNGTNPQVQNFIDPKTKKVLIIHKALLPSSNILNKGKTITNNRDQYISVLRSLQAKDHLKQMSQVNTPVQKNQINNKLLMKNTTLLQVKSNQTLNNSSQSSNTSKAVKTSLKVNIQQKAKPVPIKNVTTPPAFLTKVNTSQNNTANTTLINPSFRLNLNNQAIRRNDNSILSPSIPIIPITTTQPQNTKDQMIKNVDTNQIYNLMSTDFNKILPKKVRTVYHQEIDEKTDTDINDLLKGHKSIIEENNILKIKRKTKKTLKDFLSPLQIATYNTYNPTPESLKNLHDGKKINPSPVHHSSFHPKNFNLNQYNQKVRKQQINIANAIETAKLLRIVENELNSVKIAKKEKKKEKKKNKKKKKVKVKKEKKKKEKKKKIVDKKEKSEVTPQKKPKKKRNYFYRKKKRHIHVKHISKRRKSKSNKKKKKKKTQN